MKELNEQIEKVTDDLLEEQKEKEEVQQELKGAQETIREKEEEI